MKIYVYKLPNGSYTYTTNLNNVPFEFKTVYNDPNNPEDFKQEKVYVPYKEYDINNLDEIKGIDIAGNLILKTPDELFLQKKQKFLQNINQQAKEHILSTLKQDDWGNTYEECLAELQSSALHLETRLLYVLKQKKANLTLTEIREKIALYLANQYTQTDLLIELQALALTQTEINNYMKLFSDAAYVARLLYWIEQIWDYVEQIEQQIQNANTVEELQNIEKNIAFPEFLP